MHAHLKALVSGMVGTLPLPEFGFAVEFFEASGVEALADNGNPVFLPATSEDQAACISNLRDCGHWLSPVVAVVHDYNGHQTYSAIKHGASSVLNLAIPVGAQLEAVRATAINAGNSRADADTRVSNALMAPYERAAGFAGEPTMDDEELDRLKNMLCSEETVSAIARRFFCSERTLYRRIRMLYDKLQVSSRAELRSLLATSRRAG
ncbi:MAG: response regulator transcription factor [Saccharopolyspora sp.]|uniref:helix-turn-helix transcriptional regulator n=1 Tax=Saccharopolyspora TaxID=1835 RepID=UPI00190D32DD|nr:MULTISPECIES: response regulator transcription factor [unclassified Saccharopolyspora]MBK0870759.1 response regulator transcription factor [Saccharopolyspora sp. HNM0986]MBQ6640968.1 response regulator transcription factor [Saccharopolyspora sp.]